MKLVKNRVPPFLIGLLIGSILAIALVATWKRKRNTFGFAFPVTSVHEALGANKNWLNAFRPVRADELTGRIILLNFWASSSVSSRHILPELERLKEEFGPDLLIIGVHSAKFTNEKNSESVAEAMRRLDIRDLVINDGDFKLWSLFGIRVWPTQILVNPAGHIAGNFPGEGNFEGIRAAIRQVRTQFPQKQNSTPLPYEILMGETRRMHSQLRYPTKLTSGEGLLWVSDSKQNRILGIHLQSGKIQVEIGSGRPGLRDGDFRHAEFQLPQGIVYGRGKIWVADTGNNIIREIDLKSKSVKTIAGTGELGRTRVAKNRRALDAPISSPLDLALWNGGKTLVVAMAGAHQLWAYDFATKTVSVLAGSGKEFIDDGKYPENSLAQPSGLFEYKGSIYFVDAETSSLRVLDSKGVIKTLLGTDLFTFGYMDSRKENVLLQYPLGLYVDAGGVYIADSFNHAIRKYDHVKKSVRTLVGKAGRGYEDGDAQASKFFEPSDIKRIGNRFYVADTNNHAIRVVDPNSGAVETLDIKDATDFTNRRIASYLPMLRSAPDIALHAGLDIPVEITFTQIWKLNPDAPSRLFFFEDNGKSGRLLMELKKEDLAKKSFKLPPLVAGRRYRLQATFYYCRDGKESQCAIESRDLGIDANHDSQESKIRLTIGPYQ